MRTKLFSTLFGAAAAAGLCGGSAFGSDADLRAEIEALRTQVQTQQSQIQQLQQGQETSWIDARRSQELRSIVEEVMADADARSSAAAGGTAGWNNHFFLSSEDGNFLLMLTGQSQTRYVYNNNRGGAGDLEGFEQRRTKLGFYGKIYSDYSYGISGNFDSGIGNAAAATPDDGDFEIENAFFAYDMADGWQIKGGQFKAPFLREEAVDSAYQLAVERSLTADMFSIDYTQGLQLSYQGEAMRFSGMWHDGSYAVNSSSISDTTDFALGGRLEVLLGGNFRQFNDFAAMDEGTGLLFGTGFDYEESEDNVGPDITKWAVDLSIESGGVTFFGGLVGNHLNGGAAGTVEADQLGVVMQAGAFVVPEKMDVFFRWEYMDLDNANVLGTATAGADDKIHALTFGTNYYLHSHNAKATLDVLWLLDSSALLGHPTDTIGLAGQGLTAGGAHDDEIVVRAQFQLLF